MTPKSLLRHPMAQSNLGEFETGTTFQPIYQDPTTTPSNVKKILYCSGKVYYDILEVRKERNLENDIAIVRIEQICPFPYHLIAKDFSRFSNVKVMWLQEEHKNQGAYYYVRDRLSMALCLPLEDITYGGRPVSAAPATGSKVINKEEKEEMIEMAMKID